MQWLIQNWIWILLATGFFFMMRRGGCGMGGGMKGHENHGGHGGEMPHHADENKSADTAIDPVNKATLNIATALTSVYRGKVYYFGSAESRASFEEKPEQYAASDLPDTQQHKTHHHGC
ncbi:MAG: YHS domain-containing protein [Gallionellaceae bacterium]